ncbi:hypothetical protein NEA10_20530 (plasmid) [Phormidium yuhuli AB48]|jgi:hypothetical protein|uniref:Uncharacterized protein n=1 Tax=Phormidium yuhuli AB48 TaxID=2940671 RepID=A0ABY5AYJ2_9CYAN|nr:hypothetical protein [Phormidium yuhuli]USR93294.1 hypothetical protein NEA10_20530 [Phormidium yuhuli AB48]
MSNNIQPLKDWWGDRPARPPGSILPQYQSMNLGGNPGGKLSNQQVLSQASLSLPFPRKGTETLQ